MSIEILHNFDENNILNAEKIEAIYSYVFGNCNIYYRGRHNMQAT